MAVDDIHRLPREEVDSHFKSGSIKRVKLENFLTYDAVEFNPGPRLNVVVGPNGTGKSTILCAICLGLGGQPPLLGRADDARLFIKHEKDRATIEIELAPLRGEDGRPGATHVIRRVIDRDRGSEGGRGAGASTFFINGHKSVHKSVKQLVSEHYKIHIDNLCTFLPQDKVGNFSGFDKQALLAETEKSLSGHLYHTHLELIELEKTLQSSGVDVASLENELEKLLKENERLEREKELMEERTVLMERIDLLKKKRAWLFFDAKREEATAAKEEREKLKKQNKEAKKGIKPLEREHDQAEAETAKIQARYKALESNSIRDKKAFGDTIDKIGRYNDMVENEIADYDTIEAEARQAEKNVEKEKKQLENVEAMGEDFPPPEEIERTMKNTKKEMQVLKAKMGGEKRQMQALADDVEKASQEKEYAAKELHRLKDDKKLRLQRLFAKAPNVGEAWKFIDQNRKMFRKPVSGPIAAEIQPNNQHTASYVEQHVANATWKAYVVECKEDYDLLYREVREKRNISINIITVEKINYQQAPRMYSNERMDILRMEHGFLGYLDETFKAPHPIMQALIDRHNVDKVLVGGEAVQQSLDRKDLVEFLSSREANDQRPGKQSSCFFYVHRGSAYKHINQVSRYSGEIGTDVQDIGPAKLLQPGSDPSKKDELAETIRKAESMIAELQPQVNEMKETLLEIQKEGQQISTQFKEAQRTKKDYSQYKMKLRNQRDKYEEAMENAAKDTDKEKAKRVVKIKKLTESSILASENAATLHSDIMKHTLMLVGVKMSENGLSDKLRKLADLLKEKRTEFEELESQLNAAEENFKQKKVAMKKAHNEAEALIPKEEIDDLNRDDLPEVLEEVEEALDETEDKVNNITDNPHIMREYAERKKEIARLQEQLEDVGGEKEMKQNSLVKKLETWEAALINIVKKVSGKFSSYMKEVGCAGEVRLYNGGAGEARGNDGNSENMCYNFKDWGVEILVKFREKASLQVLSAQTHSGGERSVSTIMYLMGLQNLMVSPFRCVDEINQGLDERNERLVFKRIVENSTLPAKKTNDDHCGQYFLITPKLLPNLEGMENENITVLFVFSGAHNFNNCRDWNVDKFIEDKRRCLSQGEGNDRSSSGRGRKRKSN